VWHYLRDPKFSHFDTIPECDRHTHTDRHTMTAYTALSKASRGKKFKINPYHVTNARTDGRDTVQSTRHTSV